MTVIPPQGVCVARPEDAVKQRLRKRGALPAIERMPDPSNQSRRSPRTAGRER
jgi:hypothetical protein